MERIDELRETWEKAYRGLVKDLGNKPTLEDVACMFFELGWRAADEHPDGSQIKWETGEPKEEGEYLTTRRCSNGETYTCTNFLDEGHWFAYPCDNSVTIAWCKLSDIEPYKEE